VCVCVCVGEIISFPWFSKELKTTYQRTTGFVASFLYVSFANQYSLGEGFSFPIVLVPAYLGKALNSSPLFRNKIWSTSLLN